MKHLGISYKKVVGIVTSQIENRCHSVCFPKRWRCGYAKQQFWQVFLYFCEMWPLKHSLWEENKLGAHVLENKICSIPGPFERNMDEVDISK
jgi:hypothetical protein